MQVKEILLFRSLEPDQLNEVLDAMFEYKVKSGDDIIRQGDDGDNFYVVESGLYNIFVNTANGNQLVGKCPNYDLEVFYFENNVGLVSFEVEED